jgi:hypothetical protein
MRDTRKVLMLYIFLKARKSTVSRERRRRFLEAKVAIYNSPRDT